MHPRRIEDAGPEESAAILAAITAFLEGFDGDEPPALERERWAAAGALEAQGRLPTLQSVDRGWRG